MTAPNTKSKSEEKDHKNSIQLIVFSPANADPNDEDSRIYMVCPPSLRIVEVVEKFDEDAETFLLKLSKRKTKSSLSSKTFIDDLEKSVDSDDVIVTEEDIEALNGVDIQGINNDAIASMDLDPEIVAFASDSLDDIFPDKESGSKAASDVDMADALDILDQEEDGDEGLEELVGGLGDDDDSLPEL